MLTRSRPVLRAYSAMPASQAFLRGCAGVVVAAALAYPPVAASQQPSLWAGEGHACALDDQHALLCWGDNSMGELGDGTTAAQHVPANVANILFPVSVAAGYNHTCAVATTGQMRCWGSNDRGELGDGTHTAPPVGVQVQPLLAAVLPAGDSVIQAVAGQDATCARTAMGRVLCWGDNSVRLAGVEGAAATQPVPHLLPLEGATGLAAAHTHACAIAGGQVHCWGENSNGQLGRGATSPSSAQPAPVLYQFSPGDPDGLPVGVSARAVAAGYGFSCALLENHDVYCWGRNDSYELGDGTDIGRSAPRKVQGLPAADAPSRVASVALGENFACVLLLDGTVRCWGNNRYGQLGDDSGEPSGVPQPIAALTGVQELVVGGTFACARSSAGVACWGSGALGKLGFPLQRTRPVAVALPSGVAVAGMAAMGGSGSTCARTNDGDVHCWGENDDGQLGTGDLLRHVTPQPTLPSGNVRQLGAGFRRACALEATATEAPADHALGCWGSDQHGALGNGLPVENASAPSAVIGFSGSVAAGPPITLAPPASGLEHTCAVAVDRMLYCWGSDGNGQLGIPGSADQLAPAGPVGTDYLQVVAGQSHTCAVRTTLLLQRQVLCWGSNAAGQLGLGDSGSSNDRELPELVLQTATLHPRLAAGGEHTCILFTSNGEVQCWGSNSHGQIGDPGANHPSPTRTTVPAFDGVVRGASMIALGRNHSCAIATDDGAVWCWGANSMGQLGDGTLTQRDEPVEVVGLPGPMIGITAGEDHTCAYDTTGNAWCWGDNTDGQLGNGQASWLSEPQLIPRFGGLVPDAEIFVDGFESAP